MCRLLVAGSGEGLVVGHDCCWTLWIEEEGRDARAAVWLVWAWRRRHSGRGEAKGLCRRILELEGDWIWSDCGLVREPSGEKR